MYTHFYLQHYSPTWSNFLITFPFWAAFLFDIQNFQFFTLRWLQRPCHTTTRGNEGNARERGYMQLFVGLATIVARQQEGNTPACPLIYRIVILGFDLPVHFFNRLCNVRCA